MRNHRIDILVEQEAHALVRVSRPLDPERTTELAQQAAAAYSRLRAHPDVAELEGHIRLFEVPYSSRGPTPLGLEQAAPIIERGTIDCLVISPNGRVTVLEFKTAARRPEHADQLARCVGAVRTMFPDAEVGGRLVYLGGEPIRESSDSGEPFRG